MWSNCIIWAELRYRKLFREWTLAGRPKDRVPGKLQRPSDLASPHIRHDIVGWWVRHESRVEDAQSFVPVDERELPWWRLWRVVLFRGRVKSGDVPETNLKD